MQMHMNCNSGKDRRKQRKKLRERKKEKKRKKNQHCQDSNLIWNFSGLSRHPWLMICMRIMKASKKKRNLKRHGILH